ncbi:MAG: hypothetical protein AB8G86_27520 [Saprospiraceae bacterium]
MIARLDKILTIGFCLLWAVFIFIDYLYYHPNYAVSLEYFQYFDTVIILSLIGAAVYWVINIKKLDVFLNYLTNGVGLYLLFMLTCAVIIWTHYAKISQETLDFLSGLTYLGKISAILLACYFMVAVNYVLGDFIFNKFFSVSFKASVTRLVKLGLGITLYCLFFTIIAALGLFKMYVILPLLILILAIGWKAAIAFIKATLLKPLIAPQELNVIGFTSFFIVLIFVSLNVLANVRPFPFGFDALALYLNVPNLISQQGALIDGFSPYYWSIFMASGQTAFNMVEMSIALSAGGGILSLFAIYEITRKWLDVNFSFLITLLFYSLPLINYQSFRDAKIDLGLLFTLSIAFLVLIRWLSLENKEAFVKKIIPESKQKKKIIKGKNKSKNVQTEVVVRKEGFLANKVSASNQLIIILGILTGLALGIKLTALLFIFAVLTVFSFVKGGTIGFVANFALTIFIILIGELDTSLRAYHFGVANLQWVMLLLGLISLGYVWYTKRQQFISLISIAAIYIAFIALIYAPWPIKNYAETGTFSIETITGAR